MKDGEYTFYAIQHRLMYRSKWRQLDVGEEVKDKSWCYSSHDAFGAAFNPWRGKGNDAKPAFRASSDECHDVWATTGRHGWWSLRYAIEAMERVQRMDEEGCYDSHDNYKRDMKLAIRRHQFRVVKVTVAKTTRVVAESEIPAIA